MGSINIGAVCMKIVGREGGGICTVVKKVDKTFVIVTGPKLVTGIKRRKCNVLHLEPVGISLDVKEDAKDEEVIEAYKKSGVVAKFNLKLPSAGEMKGVKQKAEAKAETKEVVGKTKIKESKNK